MKKITFYAAAAAAAVLALVSCNKNESGLFGGGKTRITICARPEEAQENTKTLLSEEASPTGGSVYHSKWSNSGEELGVIFGEITDKSKSIKLTAEETTDNNPIFTGNATLDDGTYNMFLFYPASAFEKCYAAGTVGLNIKAVQHPVLGTFDPTCDILSWSTDNAVVSNSSFTLEGITMARPMAILRVNLNAPAGGDKALEDGIGSVTGFKMEVAPGETSSEKVTLTGRAALVPATGLISNWNVENNYVEASIDAAEMITIGESDGFQSVYLIVNPATIPSGREITFSVETEKYSGANKIVRTVTATADMVFEAGKVNTINLTLRDKDFPGTIIDEDYNGDWLITGIKNDVTYAALAFNSGGSNLKATEALTFSADGSTISSATDLSNCVMTFTEVTEGTYKGMYTIKDANGKYLYASGSSSNQLKAKDEPDVNAYWTVTMEGEEYSIIASKSSNRNVMRFNPNGNNDAIVACYASASQSPVRLYPASMISGLTTDPVITFEGAEPMDDSSSKMVTKTVSATATSVEFPYTKNKYVTEPLTVRKYSYMGAWFVPDNGWEVTDSKVTVTLTPNTTQYTRNNQLIVLGQGFTDEARMYLLIIQEAAKPAATISTVLAGGAGTYDSIENLLVYDVKGKNVIVGDETGKMLLFMDNHNLEKGDIFSMTNAVTTAYQDVVLEITGGTIDKKSSGNAVNHGSSLAIDDYSTYNTQLAAFSAEGFHPAIYVAMIGDQSGRNIQGSNAKLYLSAANDATNNKRVETTGYVYAYSSSHSNFYYQAVSITEYIAPGTPTLSVSPNELSWAPNEYGQSNAKEVTVTLNSEVDEDHYTISGADNNWATSIVGNKISVYPKTANTGTTARTFSFDVVHADDNTVKQTVTCTQAANAVTIATILADTNVTASNTVNYEVDGVTVMAAQGRNYIIADATGIMLLYAPSGTTLTVGKQYKVNGGVKLYNGVHEFTGSLSITESTGTAPAAGTPETMTVSSLTAYASAPVTKYAVVTATAESSGYLCSDGTNTINVYDGTGTWSQFYGKQVKITGYLIGFSNKINMIATAIEEYTDPNAKTLSLSSTEITWAYNEGGMKRVMVTQNAGASGYTLSYTASNDWLVQDLQSSGKSEFYVNPTGTNSGTTSKTLTIKVIHKDDATVFETLTLSQKPANAEPKTLSFSFTSNPGGWPTASSPGNYTYSIDNIGHIFELGTNVYIGTYSGQSYLMLKSTTTLRLPGIQGYKLTKVVIGNSSGCSTSTKVAVTTNTSGALVSGGAAQTFSNTSSSYTYNLSGTASGMGYYLYVTNKNCQIVSLDLTYEPA